MFPTVNRIKCGKYYMLGLLRVLRFMLKHLKMDGHLPQFRCLPWETLA